LNVFCAVVCSLPYERKADFPVGLSSCRDGRSFTICAGKNISDAGSDPLSVAPRPIFRDRLGQSVSEILF
jgi:hypothetical protein